MTLNDAPIHLTNYKICKKSAHTEAQVTVPVFITQSNLDAIQALIKWIAGFQAGGNRADVPGGFELMMHYRSLASAIVEAEANALKEK